MQSPVRSFPAPLSRPFRGVPSRQSEFPSMSEISPDLELKELRLFLPHDRQVAKVYRPALMAKHVPKGKSQDFRDKGVSLLSGLLSQGLTGVGFGYGLCGGYFLELLRPAQINPLRSENTRNSSPPTGPRMLTWFPSTTPFGLALGTGSSCAD